MSAISIALASVAPASAAVLLTNSQAAFTQSGTIAQNSNFDSAPAGFSFPGSPFVVGALTFVEGSQNLIGGVATGFNLLRPLFTDNFVAGTTVQVAGQYNLFGLNAGNFFNTGTTRFDVRTNVASYVFNESVDTAAGRAPLKFFGFTATGGEFITSVAYSGQNATGATDFQIGNLGAVPEPAAWAMMIAGFGMIGAAMRRRRTAVRVAFA